MPTAATERLPRTRTGRPRLQRTDDVLSYWAERIDQIAPERENFSYSSMICESDRLFHYGHHFELGRILRDKRGRARLVLLNGDSYGGAGGFGPSTSARQRSTRTETNRHNVPTLVVPFSALEGAGIHFDSIRPIHVREDRWTHEDRSSSKRPAKLTTMEDPSGRTRTEMYVRYDHEAHRSVPYEVEIPVRVPDPNRTVNFSDGHGFSEDGAERGEDGVWRWTVRRHWLGDAIFRARSTETRTRPATADERTAVEQYEAWNREPARLRALQESLPSSYERGDRLTARRSRRYYSLRRHGRYGRTSASDESDYSYGKMFRLALAAQGISDQLTAHYHAQPERPNVNRDGRVPYRVTRWATFLSSFDYQESRPLYFLCELPYGAKPSTVDEAIEALKPPEVVAALARGLNVVRQGDLFAIPTKLTKRQIRRMRGREDFTKRLRVLGTNHSVTEGIVLKGGAVLGRGIMRHEPEDWRPPDHATQKLGDTWHLLVRNTVPRTS